MIEKMYGTGVFYEDAANIVIPEGIRRGGRRVRAEEIVSRPEISVTQIGAGQAVSSSPQK